MCDHQFAYAGVRYAHGSNNRPGSGAKQRYYAHVYYCTKCTETRGEPITGDWNSYQKLEFNATPGNADQCGVPKHDRDHWHR